MPKYSKYTIVVDNISSSTRSRDIEDEFRYAGKIRDMARDHKYRCALIEYERAADASYAWKKLDGLSLHGRKLKVEWAQKEDFKLFGWKWYEYTPSPSPKRGRSLSRSRSASPASSASRSRSRSRTPPETPMQQKEQQPREHSVEDKEGEKSDEKK